MFQVFIMSQSLPNLFHLQDERGSHNKVSKLLSFLCKGDGNTLHNFIESLRASRQGHLAEIIVEARRAISGTVV